MATVRDIIKSSMRKIGAIASGETPSAEEMTDGMSALNSMLGSWSNESLMVPTRVRETFSLVGSQSSYSMGSGGDFDTDRPIKIEQAGIIISGGSEHPVRIITKEEYAKVTLKTTGSDIPLYLYPEYTSPSVTLILWPVPSAANSIAIYSWKALTTYSNLSTSLILAPGYEEAITWNLAVKLAPEYGLPVNADVRMEAMESKAWIKRTNAKPFYLQVDKAAQQRHRSYNILSGEYE